MNGLSGKIVFEIISHTSTLFDNKYWLNKLEPRPYRDLQNELAAVVMVANSV